MCRCSPYNWGRYASHPWGHRSGRESSSSRGHTWEGQCRHRQFNVFVRCLWMCGSGCIPGPTHPTKKQKRQNNVFISPTSWEMRVTMACWQCGHTVCTGDVWNISPCSTVTVVVAPWPPIWTNWPGPGPICPAIGWGKWPGGGGYIPPRSEISHPEPEIHLQASTYVFYTNCLLHLAGAWAWAWA